MNSLSPKPNWTGSEALLFELSGDYTSIDENLEQLIPEKQLRKKAAAIPAVPEPQLARHFGRLARRNHHLHHGSYPLGSCTMKYNPVVNEKLANLEGLAALHPYQDDADSQGALQLMHSLERFLVQLTGMDQFSLQPAAGAHGEWAGLMMINAYHLANGDKERTQVLIPDSAHGTNPASAAMCELEVISIPSNKDGTVSAEAVRQHLNPKVAAIMMTNPNTLGVFEKEILSIAKMAHENGSLLYYDGANLNALVGVARPGAMGFDVVHLNLHKTFSTPHGGGGPGAGPVGVSRRLAPFLPVPVVIKDDEQYRLDWERPQSIGKVRSFYGNFGMLVRAYAYIRTYGDLIAEVAKTSVLNAQYLQKKLTPLFGPMEANKTLHEFVVSPKGGKVEGLRALDIAKRLIDYGVYPPTIYFPTTVPEALMFEPTETESKESLDFLAAVCEAIVEEAQADLAYVKAAPHNAPVKRVDEVGAARNPVLRWKPQT